MKIEIQSILNIFAFSSITFAKRIDFNELTRIAQDVSNEFGGDLVEAHNICIYCF